MALSTEQQIWVEQTLYGMSIQEKVGHLLCPEDQGWDVDQWLELLREVPIGSAFFKYDPPDRCLDCIDALQAHSRIPLLIASDLEHGAGAMIAGTTNFPWPMAAAAAGDPDLIFRMGRATAREGRAWGAHWTFSPVVDLNLNFQNPVTNIRSLGDDPQKVVPLAAALIRGIQADGLMAATAKHFPGDGVDDRDQHICTSINSLDLSEWRRTYGKVWQAAFDAGVASVMSGHISLPAYEGLPNHSPAAMPASLNAKLQNQLLRRELGFEGLIVSDAAVMIGMSSRVSLAEKAIQNIMSGSDVYLFADPRADFHRLLEAVRTSFLPMNRVDDAVRRVLTMKASLNLHRSASRIPLAAGVKTEIEADAQAIAEKSITLLRASAATPIHLESGSRVLTVTVSLARGRDQDDNQLPAIDTELRGRGLEVEHLSQPDHQFLLRHAAEYDAVFINVVIHPHARIGTIRLTGELVMAFWEAFWADCPNAVFTSFGNPYLLYELPHLPNLYLAYGHSLPSQKAAVKVWLGEIEPQGKCPVRLFE